MQTALTRGRTVGAVTPPSKQPSPRAESRLLVREKGPAGSQAARSRDCVTLSLCKGPRVTGGYATVPSLFPALPCVSCLLRAEMMRRDLIMGSHHEMMRLAMG